MSAFDPEALWNKSKVFVDRALEARDNNDDMEFHLWAALSLEVLGKAALAHVNPALVADPNHFKSLLAACGITKTTNLRSVTAKTVFDRLGTVLPDFDDRVAKSCMLMANRRNAELHSGESPVVGLDPRSWVPAFWRASEILVSAQGRDLQDWLGEDETKRVVEILRDSAETLRQTVLARIDRRRRDFFKRCPPDSAALRDAKQRAALRPIPSVWEGEEYNLEFCPACELEVWVRGEEESREIIDESLHEEEYYHAWVMTVEVTYVVESFRCPECMLELDGRAELEVTDIELRFKREEEEEPDYEADYGND